MTYSKKEAHYSCFFIIIHAVSTLDISDPFVQYLYLEGQDFESKIGVKNSDFNEKLNALGFRLFKESRLYIDSSLSLSFSLRNRNICQCVTGSIRHVLKHLV